jgi:hypothetical protein
MYLLRRSIPPCAAVILACLTLVSAAGASALRVPQVPFNTVPLQNYMNIVDPGVNVATDQIESQVWSVGFTGNSDFTLMLETGLGAADAIGVYNALAPMGPVPPLFQVFPPYAAVGWYATLHFTGLTLVVSLFDNNSTFQGQTAYNGVDADAFAFYISGPGGTWYSQDGRNVPPGPQMLAYDGIFLRGDFWLAFEEEPYAPTSTFNGIVLNVQSLRPVPAVPATWGGLKNLYR